MKKHNKFWQGFFVASIAALTVPSFVEAQATGSGSSGSSSGMTSGSSSNSPRSGSTDKGTGSSSSMPGSGGTHSGTPGTSGMTGSSAGAGGMPSASTGHMGKDIASTEADQRINSQIRQALNADTSLAGVGRNVHLNTQNGQVTLHGSVSSEVEKNQIEQKVKQMTNVDTVNNQLQVANSGTSSSKGGASGSSSSMGSGSSSSRDSSGR